MTYHDLEEECLAYKLIKERYCFELQRKNEINNIISIPAALISGIVAFIAFICSSFPERNDSGLWYFFCVVLGLSVLGLIVALVCFFKHQLGRKYEYVASPQDIYNYEKECESTITNAGLDISYPKINNLICDFMFKQYVECAEANKRNNKEKNDYYRRLMLAIVATLLLLTIAFVCKLLVTVDAVPKIKIENSSPIEVKMKDEVFVKNNDALKVKIKDSVHVSIVQKNKKKRMSKASKRKKETSNDCIQHR